jgi:uncharacterized membrane protein YeaQ/YmgE (transglycosylase-associated protein family)
MATSSSIGVRHSPRSKQMSMIYSIISWIIFGGIVGAIARFLVPGRQAMSLLMTIVMGVIGSFVGGAISWLVYARMQNPRGV